MSSWDQQSPNCMINCMLRNYQKKRMHFIKHAARTGVIGRAIAFSNVGFSNIFGVSKVKKHRKASPEWVKTQVHWSILLIPKDIFPVVKRTISEQNSQLYQIVALLKGFYFQTLQMFHFYKVNNSFISREWHY